MGFGLVSLGLSLFSAVKGAKAGRERKRGRHLDREITAIKNRQAKRAFKKNFLIAQGQALAGGAASGADLESSAVQASLASNQTQFEVGSREATDQVIKGQNRDLHLDRASKAAFTSSLFQTAASFAANTSFGVTPTPVPPPTPNPIPNTRNPFGD